MSASNAVSEEFLGQLMVRDLVGVNTAQLGWSGPHKLLMYKIDPPRKGGKPAAYMEIELGEKRLKRWLIVSEQQVIRKHIPEERKQGQVG